MGSKKNSKTNKKIEKKKGTDISLEQETPEESDEEIIEDSVDSGQTDEKDQQNDGTEDTSVKIKALEQEINELKEKNLRQMAEFDNYRKRTQREKQETYKNASADCASQFITVLDNLERAVEATDEESEIKAGVEMIVAQFKQVLEEIGVKEIAAYDQPFDPEKHSAVNQIQDEEFDENTVCQVLQKGYQMGNRIIRPSMVVVANP